MLSKNKAKFIHALKQKKFRSETGLFIMEGDKLVTEVLISKDIAVQRAAVHPRVVTAKPVYFT